MRLEKEFQRQCLKRGHSQFIPTDVSTHIDGRRFDVVGNSCPTLLVQVHPSQ